MGDLNDGSWMSTPGPYQDFVRSLCSADPTLKHRDRGSGKRGVPWPSHQPRLAVLKGQQDGNSSHKITFIKALETRDPAHLESYFQRGGLANHATIFILDGLSPEIISALGTHFMMHPSFFADHLRVSRASVMSRSEEDPLPSAVKGREHICLRYCELLALPRDVGNEFGARCADTARHIDILRTFGVRSEVAMLARKCTIWRRISSKNAASSNWCGMY
jgi:hypothetical protein